MSTIEDFENAPIGATAYCDDGVRAMKMLSGGEPRWIAQGWSRLDVEGMVNWGYKLDPPAPTTAREALDLAWELAHPVKEGQVIPEGTRYLEVTRSGLRERAAVIDHTIKPRLAPSVRTLEKLPDPEPDPEPDWLGAPAVLATCYGCDEDGQAQSVHVPSFRWWRCTVCTSDVSWRVLDDVTPLYPPNEKGTNLS